MLWFAVLWVMLLILAFVLTICQSQINADARLRARRYDEMLHNIRMQAAQVVQQAAQADVAKCEEKVNGKIEGF